MEPQPDNLDKSLTEFGFSRFTQPLKRTLNTTLKAFGTVVGVGLYAGSAGLQSVVRKSKEVSAESEKKTADSAPTRNWLEDVLLLVGTSLPAIRSEVQDLARQSVHDAPDAPVQFHASRVSSKLIKRKAIKSGIAGGLASSPGVIPGIGTLGTLAVSLTADLAHLLRTQLELCYGIATAYGVDMDKDEMRSIALALIGFSGTAEAARGMSATVIREIIDQTAANYLAVGAGKATTLLMRRIGLEGSSRALRALPFLGIPLGASINIASTVMVGKQAKKYFSTWIDDAPH